MSTEVNIKYVDINKGFRRLGNFPAFTDEIFNSYSEASEYALTGKYGGSSYVGQLIRIMPDDVKEDPSIYIINSEYKLASTNDHITTNDNLSVNFSYSSMSGSEAISLLLPQGFILNNISIRIIEGFKNDNAIKIGMCPYIHPEQLEYLVQSGPEANFENPPRCLILTDEDDSEFNFHFTKQIEQKTLLIVFINRVSDSDERGKGILKIN